MEDDFGRIKVRLEGERTLKIQPFRWRLERGEAEKGCRLVPDALAPAP